MSRLIVSLLALGSLALTACAPAPDEQQQALDQAEQRAELAAAPPPAPPPAAAVDAAACDPVQAQRLVGKTPTDADIEQARLDAGAQSARTLNPGQPVTMEFNATRLNVELDDTGAVASVRCG